MRLKRKLDLKRVVKAMEKEHAGCRVSVIDKQTRTVSIRPKTDKEIELDKIKETILEKLEDKKDRIEELKNKIDNLKQ